MTSSFESHATEGPQKVEKVRFLIANAQRVLDGESYIADSTYEELSQEIANDDPQIEPLRQEVNALLKQLPVADVRNHLAKAVELGESYPNDAADWLEGGLQRMTLWKKKGLLSEGDFVALAEKANEIEAKLAQSA